MLLLLQPLSVLVASIATAQMDLAAAGKSQRADHPEAAIVPEDPPWTHLLGIYMPVRQIYLLLPKPGCPVWVDTT